MKTTTNQKIKVGVLTLVGLAILFILIFVIGSQKNMFNKNVTVHGYFSDVAGLKSGSYVRLAGINVGTVSGISIVDDSTVQVDIDIIKSQSKFIKSNSLMSISNDGLMGDKFINLSSRASNDSSYAISNGMELETFEPMNMDKVMARVNSITESADILVNNLANISYKISTGKGTLGKLLNDDGIAKNLEGTLASAKKTVENANKAAVGVAENMEAAKHNFLFKGYFKRKEKKRIQDSIANAQMQTEKKMLSKKRN